MPLTGGPSDKYGARYELRWTAFCLLAVIDETWDSIRLEPPGDDGDGVEFCLCKGDRREYHQAKRQHGGQGHWTLDALKSTLSHFWNKLADPHASCVFVSSHAADQLSELADRARSAASWEEFEQAFLSSNKLSTNFSKLTKCWEGSTRQMVYERLNRIRVRTIDEETLRTSAESRIQSLMEGDPSAVLAGLQQLVLDKVHQALTAQDLWQYLEARGQRRHQWGNDPHVVAAVESQSRIFLNQLRTRTIAGMLIPREEADRAVQVLTRPSGRKVVMLCGEAGVGKSGLLPQVADPLRDQGWPVLAFRVDRLEPTPSPRKVGEQLGLPGSPALVLASIAAGKDSLLVIDQLDAVSLASGRNPQFWDCLEEILLQALECPHMRVLLACRGFDLENDHRIRRLTGKEGVAEVLQVKGLPDDTVRRVVSDLGLDATHPSTNQLKLLSVPLHLSLLAQVASGSGIGNLGFDTVEDLYDLFWDHKQDVIRTKLGRPPRFTEVLDILTGYMSERQLLYAPAVVLDGFEEDTQAMASENVLVKDDNKYSFFHEGFFDYSFARRWCAQGKKLLPLLLAGEQHLFRRAQLRQMLLYKRSTDRGAYQGDLASLLAHPEVRFNLKDTVCTLLSQLRDPTADEWKVLSRFTSKETSFAILRTATSTLVLRAAARIIPGRTALARRIRVRTGNGSYREALARHVWQAFRGSPAWFRLLLSEGLIRGWLGDRDEELVTQSLNLLQSVQRKAPDEVAQLLEPFIGASKLWDNRLRRVVEWSEIGASPRFLEFVLHLLDKGVLDDARGPIAVNSDFWDLVYSLPKAHPDWACQVIGHYLNRRLVLSGDAGTPNPFDCQHGTIPDSQSAAGVILESARGAPLAFVDQVLPFVVKVMEQTADRSGDSPWRDPIWGIRFYGGVNGLDDALLSAMELSLSALAANNPNSFANVASRLKALEFETVQYLLIRAYTKNPKRFADDAAVYLCERPARLSTGYAQDTHWATRQLLEAITPHCSEITLAEIQQILLNYYPALEKTRDGMHQRGLSQMGLLEAIVSSRRSATVRARLDEWQRKFPKHVSKAPQPIETIGLGSPVPVHAANKMTDDQWAKAMERYKDVDVQFRTDGTLAGGAHELARVLERSTKDQPDRFARLGCSLQDHVHPAYFDAILCGVAETGLDADLSLPLCRRCHKLPKRPCGKSISLVIKKLANSPLPVDALEMVAWYAVQDADPTGEPLQRKDPSYRDVFSDGINSVRGSAAEAMARLILADSLRIPYFLPTVRSMVGDSSVAVRSCVAATLIAVLRHDRDTAVKLFLQLVEAEDVLLATQHVDRFLFFAAQTHFGSLSSVLKRMVASRVSDVAVAGARLTWLTSLSFNEAMPLARRCLHGSESQRLGAAEVLAANLHQAANRSVCEQGLITLFGDSSERVRAEAASCFNQFEGRGLEEHVGLIEAFVKSAAFITNSHPVINAVNRTTARIPKVTLLVCDRFVEEHGPATADIRTASAGLSDTVSHLLLRVYTQTTDQMLKSHSLDLIDRMTAFGAYGLQTALAQLDR